MNAQDLLAFKDLDESAQLEQAKVSFKYSNSAHLVLTLYSADHGYCLPV
jgi:hypothetical protein